MAHSMRLPDGWIYADGLGRTAYKYRYNNRITYYVAKVDHEWLAAFSCDGEMLGFLTNEDGLPVPTGFKTALDAIKAVMANAGEHDPDECAFTSVNGIPYLVRSPLYNEAIDGA